MLCHHWLLVVCEQCEYFQALHQMLYDREGSHALHKMLFCH